MVDHRRTSPVVAEVGWEIISSDGEGMDEGHRYQVPRAISSLQPLIPRNISACLVDPFIQLPIEVDTITNQLLHYYSTNSYWSSAYGLSPRIRPSIKGSWEYQAGDCLTHFHILMARSALHQLRLAGDWSSNKGRRELEYAAINHQSQAITILRRNVDLGQRADLKLILTSVISLATFEMRYGDARRVTLHFKTGRDLIHQIGLGEDNVLNDRLREEQALWFEGIYRDPAASWMWGPEDLRSRLSWLRSTLSAVDKVWRERQLLSLRAKSVGYVLQDTRLHEFLSRDLRQQHVGIYGDIDDSIAQQRCVWIIVALMKELHTLLEESPALNTTARAKGLIQIMKAYTEHIEDCLIEHDLGKEQALADLLWVMTQRYRDVKHHLLIAVSDAAAREAVSRLDLRRCHWRASGIANVGKYLPQTRQKSLRSNLLAFIDGQSYTEKLRFDEFEFSYAG